MKAKSLSKPLSWRRVCFSAHLTRRLFVMMCRAFCWVARLRIRLDCALKFFATGLAYGDSLRKHFVSCARRLGCELRVPRGPHITEDRTCVKGQVEVIRSRAPFLQGASCLCVFLACKEDARNCGDYRDAGDCAFVFRRMRCAVTRQGQAGSPTPAYDSMCFLRARPRSREDGVV